MLINVCKICKLGCWHLNTHFLLLWCRAGSWATEDFHRVHIIYVKKFRSGEIVPLSEAPNLTCQMKPEIAVCCLCRPTADIDLWFYWKIWSFTNRPCGLKGQHGPLLMKSELLAKSSLKSLSHPNSDNSPWTENNISVAVHGTFRFV